MIDELLLLSGTDVPFADAHINIRQPLIREIAFIGEENFFMGCQLLNFSKDLLSQEDRISLADTDDFDILMSILCSTDASLQQVSATMVLALLFPEYSVSFEPDGIYLLKGEDLSVINSENFAGFKEILSEMVFYPDSKKEEFKPANEKAQAIADKLKKGREKLAAIKNPGDKKISVLSRYSSILAIGLRMDLGIFLNQTVYQLYDQFKRFQMYQAFDINLKARLAGASDLEEVDNWMDDIHS
jgi:hypothetical protein